MKRLLLLLFTNILLLNSMAQDSTGIDISNISSTLRIFGSDDINIKAPYEIVGNKVFYVWVGDIGSSRPMPRKFFAGTELNTNFVILENQAYAKDSEKVYRLAKKLPGADPATFEVINLDYSKDNKNVYYLDSLIIDADAQSFEVIKNKEKEKKGHEKRLLYSKDKNHVYFLGKQIEHSDPSTFQHLYPYSKDKNHVYSETSIMKNADPETFIAYGDDYSKDTNNVYYKGEIIEGANPVTFICNMTSRLAKDDKHVFYKTRIIEHADPRTFRYDSPSDYSRDATHVFYKDKLVKGADVNTYDVRYHNYIRDKESLFYQGEKIEGLDMTAYEIDFHNGLTFVYDKQYIYYNGQKEKIDINTFSTYANVRPPVDKNYIFLIEPDGIRKIENNRANFKKYVRFKDGFNKLLK